MNIKVELPGGAEPTQGQMITFTAPLDGSDADYLEINGKQYWFMGTDNNECVGPANGWEAGALIAVVMDVINGYAFVLNSYMTASLRSSLQQMQKQLNRLPIPTSTWSPTYDGSVKWAEWDNATIQSVCDVTGETEAIDAGPHYVTFTIKEKYADMWTWEDGTSDPKTVSWEIKRATINRPLASDVVYNGNPQSPSWSYYDEDRVTGEGTMSATNAGTYAVTFTPTKNYSWTDGSTGPYTEQWYILRQVVDVPTQSGTLTFNNANQSPSWSGYDTAKMTISAGNTGMHAGSYTTTFVTTDNYCFARYGSKPTTYETEKTANWTISQKVLTMSVSPTSLSLDAANDTATIQVTHNGYNDGNLKLSCSSSVKPSGLELTTDNDNWTVTVQAKSTCEEDVTISLTMTQYLDYHLPTKQVVPVTATMIDSTLANNSWETIHSISAAGQAANYWSVGDGKEITIKGTVADLAFDDTVTAYIIGVNHNAAKEGDNLTHFCIGKKGSTEIALFNGSGFKMNSSATKIGGWDRAALRKTTLGNTGEVTDPPATPDNSLMKALPTELVAVLQPVTKYTSNGSVSGQADFDIVASTDYLFLMSEKELCGATGQGTSEESSYQEQYAYYVAGNSKTRYKDSALTSYTAYWTRSPGKTSNGRFCSMSAPAGSTCALQDANKLNGIAPCFCV